VSNRLQPRSSDAYDAWVKATDWLLMVLSLVFVVVLVAPLILHLTKEQQEVLFAANVAIWIVFLVDYLVRVYLVPDRRHFVRTHVVDLLVVTVPFLRPLRLLRLFSILSEFTQRSQRSLAGRAMTLVFTVAAVFMAVGAVVVYNFERSAPQSNIKTFPDALWWAVSTVTTVGYGDVYPTTEGGRVIAVILMLTGIALVGTLTAAIASWFVGSSQRAQREIAAEEAQQAQNERQALLAEMSAVKATLDQIHSELSHMQRHLPMRTGGESETRQTP
jgi:voltage-gated potassium channel